MTTSSPPSVPSAEQVRQVLAELDSTNVVLESLTVDTASRKFMELERDTTPAVIAARNTFFSGIATALGDASPPVALIDAMGSAGGQLIGLGPEPGFAIPTPMVLYSASSIADFYQYNVSNAWKQVTAQVEFGSTNSSLWQNPGSPVYEYWLTQVANTTVPVDMIDQNSMASIAGSWSWWTPDSRMNMPPAADGGSSSAGTQAFFAQCWIVSLAPEWYPWGLVTFAFTCDPTLDSLRRPTPYDGTTSPLWVQRPTDQAPATGGQAIETLLGSALPITRVQPVPTYVIASELVAALQTAAQVNVYAQNLCEVSLGTTEAGRHVAAWQVAITEQCRQQRAASDASFDAALIGSTCPCSQPSTKDVR